jgi:hypothetical protein
MYRWIPGQVGAFAPARNDDSRDSGEILGSVDYINRLKDDREKMGAV